MENTRSPKHQLEPADQSLDVHKRRQMDVLTFHPQPRDDQSQISPPINNAYLGETSQVLEVEAPGINSDGDLDWLTASWLPDAINDPSPADDAVCYGMLPSIMFQLKWLPDAYSPSSHDAEGGERYIMMHLQLKPEHGMIFTEVGDAIALLNKRSFEVLFLAIGGDQAFDVVACVTVTEWDKKSSELRKLSKNNRKIVRLEADVLLYGPRDDESLAHVASSLGKRRAYLQDPHVGIFRPPYMNPQSLEVPKPVFTTREAESTLHIQPWQDDEDDLDDSMEGDSMQLEGLVMDIDLFFERLPARQSERTVLHDRRITSPLFSHQQEGIDFMVSRETMASRHNTLWEQESLESGEVYFRHSITGAKSKIPDDFPGGILADEMGLGKTFTTLCAILASQDRAAEYASQRAPGKSGKALTIYRSKATVVVVSSELLLNTWAREIERHFLPWSIQYTKYHGQGRENLPNLDQQDVILTTYGTVMADRRRGNSIIYLREWWRLVLDEAHTIRNWGSKQFNAIQSIPSHIRWCLTGTPIQNSLDDLASLVKFLKMPVFEEPAIFRKYVTKVRRSQGSTNGEFENLRLLLSTICLRRNKGVLPMQGQHQVEIRRPVFKPHEQQEYQSLALACKRAIMMGSKGDILNSKNHTKVMQALLSLRMYCNNGWSNKQPLAYSNGTDKSSPRRADEVLSVFQQSGEDVCADCAVDILSIGDLSNPDSGHLTPCWRLVCNEYKRQMESELSEGNKNTYTCQFCSQTHSMDHYNNNRNSQEQSAESDEQYPTKILCLVDDIQAHYQASKCIVFSFWKTTLDVVGRAMESRGLQYLRVDGDVASKKRDDIIQKFQSDSTQRVLTITFSTGSVGLNGLTVANRIHILEPQWNPAVENQAIGRVLRLDQMSRVTVVRYAMLKSIEEVVQTRQVRKLYLASGGFNKEKRQDQVAGQLQHLQGYLQEYLDSKGSSEAT